MPITDFVETAIEVAASRDGHFLETTAWVSETHPHLAITQSLATGSGNFVITHVESGYAAFYGYSNLEAMKLFFERVYDKVDWTLPKEDIAFALRKNLGVEELYPLFDNWYDECVREAATKAG